MSCWFGSWERQTIHWHVLFLCESKIFKNFKILILKSSLQRFKVCLFVEVCHRLRSLQGIKISSSNTVAASAFHISQH